MGEQQYLLGKFEVIISSVKKGEDGAIQLKKLLDSSMGDAPSWKHPLPNGGGRDIPIPEGSIRAYIKKHHKEFSGDDPYVRVEFKYIPAPGEKPPYFPIPQGAKLIYGGGNLPPGVTPEDIMKRHKS